MSPEALAVAAEAVSVLFVVTTFAVVARTRLEAHVRTYAAQSALLAVLAGAGAIEGGAPALAVAAVFTFVVKVLVVPRLLGGLLDRLGARREVEAYVTPSTSLLISGGLAALAYGVAADVAPRAAGILDGAGPLPLAASLTGVFVGLLVMATRKKAVTQVFGLLLFENGVQFAVFTTAGEMPVLVEIGVAFDLLVAVVVLGVLVLRMRETFGDVDAARLRELRG